MLRCTPTARPVRRHTARLVTGVSAELHSSSLSDKIPARSRDTRHARPRHHCHAMHAACTAMPRKARLVTGVSDELHGSLLSDKMPARHARPRDARCLHGHATQGHADGPPLHFTFYSCVLHFSPCSLSPCGLPCCCPQADSAAMKDTMGSVVTRAAARHNGELGNTCHQLRGRRGWTSSRSCRGTTPPELPG